MSLFTRIRAAGQLIALSSEEARTVMNALRRSSEGMPDATETIGSRESRARRETRIADRIGALIEGGI